MKLRRYLIANRAGILYTLRRAYLQQEQDMPRSTSLRLLDKMDLAAAHLQGLPDKATHTSPLLHRADLDCAHNLHHCAKILHLEELRQKLVRLIA